MNISERNAIDELIDHCNGLLPAIDTLKRRIARRQAEGKTSPVAEGQLAFLLSLPASYSTPKQIKSARDWRESGGFEVG